MEVRGSALKHGVSAEDIQHAVRGAMTTAEMAGEYDDRTLVLGPDRAGRLLELVVVGWGTDQARVIHAMAMRPQFRRYLPR